jgi:hypothetical protein
VHLITTFAFVEAEALLAQHGRNELEEKTVPKWLIFLKMVRVHCYRRDSHARGRGALFITPLLLEFQARRHMPIRVLLSYGGDVTTPAHGPTYPRWSQHNSPCF